MTESANEPAAPPVIDETTRARWNKKRIYGFIAVVVFVAGGFLLFGDSMPKEVYLRFDVPPVMRSSLFEIERARVAQLTATISDTKGAHVANVNLRMAAGLEGPRTPRAVLNLKPGKYVARAKVRSFEGTEVPLEGLFEVDETEIVVDLKGVR
jgi:hypothetical protein